MRKLINKRGKRSRSSYVQQIPEAQFLKGKYEEDGVQKIIDIANPNFGKNRTIFHGSRRGTQALPL